MISRMKGKRWMKGKEGRDEGKGKRRGRKRRGRRRRRRRRRRDRERERERERRDVSRKPREQMVYDLTVIPYLFLASIIYIKKIINWGLQFCKYLSHFITQRKSDIQKK